MFTRFAGIKIFNLSLYFIKSKITNWETFSNPSKHLFFSWFVMRISSFSIYFGLFYSCSCFVETFSFTIYRGLLSCTDLFILLISQSYHVVFMLQCINWSFRSFGRFTLVGTHTINSIHKFLYNPVTRFVWKQILD